MSLGMPDDVIRVWAPSRFEFIHFVERLIKSDSIGPIPLLLLTLFWKSKQ